MIPYEDYRKLKPKQSGSQVVAGSSHPLKSPAPKFYNRAANIYERREQESLDNSRPVQPKLPSITTRQHGSADAAERWSKGANSPKPASKLRGMSADAAERWSNKPKPASNLRGMSADAAERWGKGASSKPQLAIASFKKAPETKNVPLSFNKATQLQRQEERNFTNSRPLHHVTKSKTPPKPLPGSASDLTAARKALQETLKANQDFKAKPGIPSRGRLGEMEQKDLRQEIGRAKARLEASTKAKELQDFKANPSIPKNGRVRDMEIKDLQQEVSSANTRYMGTQGRDRQGQPIKLKSVEPPKPKPEKSWWDKVRDSVTEKTSDAWDKTKSAGNYVKDHAEDIGHIALDAGGMIPVAGAAFDVAHAGWYLAKGDKVNAALSATSAIPFAGDAVMAAKYGAKATGAVAGAVAVGRVNKVSQAGSTPVQRATSGSKPLRDERGRFARDPNPPLTRKPKHDSGEYRTARAELKRKTIDNLNEPSHMRGWLKQERNARGDDPRKWRNPKGYDTGHADPNDNTQLRWETSSQNRSRGARFGR